MSSRKRTINYEVKVEESKEEEKKEEKEIIADKTTRSRNTKSGLVYSGGSVMEVKQKIVYINERGPSALVDVKETKFDVNAFLKTHVGKWDAVSEVEMGGCN